MLTHAQNHPMSQGLRETEVETWKRKLSEGFGWAGHSTRHSFQRGHSRRWEERKESQAQGVVTKEGSA